MRRMIGNRCQGNNKLDARFGVGVGGRGRLVAKEVERFAPSNSLAYLVFMLDDHGLAGRGQNNFLPRPHADPRTSRGHTQPALGQRACRDAVLGLPHARRRFWGRLMEFCRGLHKASLNRRLAPRGSAYQLVIREHVSCA